MKMQRIRPILWVKKLDDTIGFYEDNLEFSCRHKVPGRFAALTKNDIEIMIVVPVFEPENCGEEENKTDLFPKSNFTGSIYIDTDNVDEYWEKIKNKVNVKYALGNQEWMVRDFSIHDNNGYEIVFGQDISEA